MCQICFAVHPSVEERLLLQVCCESHGVNKQVNKAYLNKTNPSHRVLWRSIDKISPHQKEKWTCISLNCSFIDLNKLAKAGVLKNSWHETAVHTITTDHHGSRLRWPVPIFSIPKCFFATTTAPSTLQIPFPNSALAHSSTGICCLVGSSASFNCPEFCLFAPVAVENFSRLPAWLPWWIGYFCHGSISTCVGSAELLFQGNPQPNPGKFRWKDHSESVPKFLMITYFRLLVKMN